MKSYTVRLNRDMDDDIRLKLEEKGVVITYEANFMGDLIFIETTLNEEEIGKMDFVKRFNESVVGKLCYLKNGYYN